MTSVSEQTHTQKSVETSATVTRKLIRGSSLLTLGRVIAIVVNFAVQVITVRFLIKSDYGAFAYGLSIVSMGASFALFGLGRTLNRFAPLFQERREFGRMAGTVMLSLCCVTAIGLGVVVLVLAGQGFIGSTLVHDPLSLSLLLILIVLAPLKAVDSIFEEMFATFANPKALFIRRHLVGPLLKLMCVLPLIFAHSDVRLLAISYLIGGVLGTGYSAIVLWSVLKKADLLKYFRRDSIQIPARQVFGFSLPLMSTDLLVMARIALVTVVLEFCHGALAVAAFRAVLPVARLNTFVAESFRLLFSPAISRMYARGDVSSIDRVYWRTMAWIAVATFPLFLICIGLSDVITIALFGSEYADSAGILSLLATGFYLSSIVGFNNEILKAHGYVGRIFLTDMLTIASAILLHLMFVPVWGPLGAAASTTLVLLIRPIGNQITIYRLGLLREIDWGCMRLFLLMIQATVIAWLLPGQIGNSVTNQLLTTIVGSLVVLVAALPVLDISHTFPELMRLSPFHNSIDATET
ncbi:MAG: oligosaccharide flippase family protein [Fuerstiella sp.]|nr:oligosaccharide flippase family protein [Fuerstiella sp.]MCP4509495.1 oligosaccharide flippase family protein [Fuerstiella sp.]